MNNSYSLAVDSFLKKAGFSDQSVSGLRSRFNQSSKEPSSLFFKKARENASSDSDLFTAIFFVDFYGDQISLELYWFVYILLTYQSQGHLCTPLDSLSEDVLFLFDPETLPDCLSLVLSETKGFLDSNPRLFGEKETPFIVSFQNQTIKPQRVDLLQRYFTKNIVRKLRGESVVRRKLLPQRNETARLRGSLSKKFSLTDQQFEAVLRCLQHDFVIVSGGPGTGKTTTIISIMRAFYSQAHRSGFSPVIKLAAPTGRAANRMKESLIAQIRDNPWGGSEAVDEALPLEAQTIHKLLRLHPDFNENPYYTSENPLPADLVIVDEASMIDVSLMSFLLASLPDQASLVLVGDGNQLPSVEAGAFFQDLIEAGRDSSSKLHDSIVLLKESHRSSGEILKAASLVLSEDSSLKKEVPSLFRSFSEEVEYRDLPKSADQFAMEFLKITPWKELKNKLRFPVPAEKADLYKKEMVEALKLLNQVVVLSPVRGGFCGLDQINGALMKRISSASFFCGLPIMITKNDYLNQLFNGDRGILMEFAGRLYAAFSATDDKGEGSYRLVALSRLVDYTPSYCQTIHKSQGSEYQTVFLILPADAGQLLSREILYTGLTRAREKVVLFSEDTVLLSTVDRKDLRYSDIKDMILEDETVNSED